MGEMAVIGRNGGADLEETSLNQTEFLLKRNLKDAGFGPKQTERFLLLRTEGRCRELELMLAEQRASLLKKVHENQKRIDCLDYLTHQIKRKETES